VERPRYFHAAPKPVLATEIAPAPNSFDPIEVLPVQWFTRDTIREMVINTIVDDSSLPPILSSLLEADRP